MTLMEATMTVIRSIFLCALGLSLSPVAAAAEEPGSRVSVALAA